MPLRMFRQQPKVPDEGRRGIGGMRMTKLWIRGASLSGGAATPHKPPRCSCCWS